MVYFNCDDPEISNFYHYFHQNFARLGLKQVITTCYQNQNRKMFSQHDKDTSSEATENMARIVIRRSMS